IELYLHQQGLDTTTPAGKAMFQMLGVLAEFERAIIRERVLAGMARAKAEGTKRQADRSAGDPSSAACGHPRRLQGWQGQSARRRSAIRCWCRDRSPLRWLRVTEGPSLTIDPARQQGGLSDRGVAIAAAGRGDMMAHLRG